MDHEDLRLDITSTRQCFITTGYKL
jgi:hypothetical protein